MPDGYLSCPHVAARLFATRRIGRTTRRFRGTPHKVLLRIGFTRPHSRLFAGELLPRLFILTDRNRRLFSVALSLRFPSADVICYPCPVKPGLSSHRYLSACCAQPSVTLFLLYRFFTQKSSNLALFYQKEAVLYKCSVFLFFSKCLGERMQLSRAARGVGGFS